MVLLYVVVLSVYAEISEDNSVFLSKKFQKILQEKKTYTIVVLPIQNATTIDKLPYFFRKRIASLLEAKGYEVIKFDVVDNFLLEQGVQTTDQIALVDYAKLAKATSADAILSGIIETSTLQNAVVYSGYAFVGSLKLEDRKKNLLWYSLSQRVAKRRIAIDPINILINVALDADDKKPVEAIEAVADRLIESFPEGPATVVVDDLLDQAIEIQ
jgi:hypothetical protein